MFKFVVLLSVAAMAAAKPSFVAPVGVSAFYGLPALYGAPAGYGAPAVTGWSQPGVVLDAANGVPLDTPDVVAARVSHYTAKALGPIHHLRKRSLGVAPLSPAFYGFPAVYGAPAIYGAPAVTGWSQPGVVLDAANGVPLDTPDVVAARASHYTAKALGPIHHLRKRSLGVAPLSYSTIVSRPFYSTYAVAPFAAPYNYPSVYPRALSVHPY